MAAAATGQIGCGQENDLGNHYRSHKKAISKYEKMYHILFNDCDPLDPNKSAPITTTPAPTPSTTTAPESTPAPPVAPTLRRRKRKQPTRQRRTQQLPQRSLTSRSGRVRKCPLFHDEI